MKLLNLVDDFPEPSNNSFEYPDSFGGVENFINSFCGLARIAPKSLSISYNANAFYDNPVDCSKGFSVVYSFTDRAINHHTLVQECQVSGDIEEVLRKNADYISKRFLEKRGETVTIDHVDNTFYISLCSLADNDDPENIQDVA